MGSIRSASQAGPLEIYLSVLDFTNDKEYVRLFEVAMRKIKHNHKFKDFDWYLVEEKRNLITNIG